MYCILFALLISIVSALSPLEVYGYSESDLISTVDISGDGGIKKLVIREGSGKEASAGKKINAHYDGRLASNGNPFDSSRKRGQPFGFNLGGGQVIQGGCVLSFYSRTPRPRFLTTQFVHCTTSQNPTIIAGWDKGFVGMKVGEKAILVIESEYGYGSRGMGPIPASSTLLFEVELMSVEGGADL